LLNNAFIYAPARYALQFITLLCLIHLAIAHAGLDESFSEGSRIVVGVGLDEFLQVGVVIAQIKPL
jgi:hypothetical protein